MTSPSFSENIITTLLDVKDYCYIICGDSNGNIRLLDYAYDNLL